MCGHCWGVVLAMTLDTNYDILYDTKRETKRREPEQFEIDDESMMPLFIITRLNPQS